MYRSRCRSCSMRSHRGHARCNGRSYPDVREGKGDRHLQGDAIFVEGNPDIEGLEVAWDTQIRHSSDLYCDTESESLRQCVTCLGLSFDEKGLAVYSLDEAESG
jgi:hypothetical protein